MPPPVVPAMQLRRAVVSERYRLMAPNVGALPKPT